ncbi:MAG TPA: twin-arginine translocase TatA/TatE family subunit [Thermaerobacter sp.]
MGLHNIGFAEISLILLLGIIIFGPNKLPEIGRALGNTIKEFRKSARDLVRDIDDVKTEGSKQ